MTTDPSPPVRVSTHVVSDGREFRVFVREGSVNLNLADGRVIAYFRGAQYAVLTDLDTKYASWSYHETVDTQASWADFLEEVEREYGLSIPAWYLVPSDRPTYQTILEQMIILAPHSEAVDYVEKCIRIYGKHAHTQMTDEELRTTLFPQAMRPSTKRVLHIPAAEHVPEAVRKYLGRFKVAFTEPDDSGWGKVEVSGVHTRKGRTKSLTAMIYGPDTETFHSNARDLVRTLAFMNHRAQ